MKSKYDYDIIRDYLHGLVDRETASRIRDLIRTDDIARSIAAGILQLEHDFKGNEEEIEAYIEGLRQKQLKRIDEQAKKGRTTSFGWMKLAAAILIVAVAGSVVWFQNEDVLARELGETYPLAIVDRGVSDVNPGFEFYRTQQYTKAIESFDKIQDDVNVTFYNGLSNLYLGDYSRAATLLGSESLQKSRYKEQARWFQALALLKIGQKDEAKENLLMINNSSGHYKSAEAGKLLQELN